MHDAAPESQDRGPRAATTGPVGVGLTAREAAARLAESGPNELPRPQRRSALRTFVDQLVHFFALMLWVAGLLAMVGGLPQLGVAIFVVIVLNATFAFAQERRADRAAEKLQALLPRTITARRDGRPIRIDAAEVVVGDVLVLVSGDRIPADATASGAVGLRVDTSLLTGESDPQTIESGGALHAGTFVVEGDADAIVTATASGTRLAAIAELTSATEPPASPLTIALRRVVRTVAAIALGVGGAFFLLSLLLGNPPSDGFVFAIGVTVALVPEALLPTVTLALAWGAEQMADRRVLVRNLDAVETLGSTTFICTDKTGTLTRNEMTVVQAWTPTGTATASTPGYDPHEAVDLSAPSEYDAMAQLALAGVRCSSGLVAEHDGQWRPHGDPMEAAIDVFAMRLGLDTVTDRSTTAKLGRFAFDPRRRRMSVLTAEQVLVKGAPDSVLPLCSDPAEAEAALDGLTGRGLRVLAVAGRPIGDSVPLTSEEAEQGLELYGLLALEDPPRLDAREALAACRSAGIKVAMITGDHPTTAAVIADEVGLREPDGLLLTGDDLPADDEVLAALIDRDGVVLARVSPEQKLRVAKALRSRGHVVAMTGDGVNDGPALHEADIGIAMGTSGTDVAREAADLVLLDDHFASIVDGIEQGRASFLNVRRFLTYHLTDNVAELTPFVLWALSGGRFPLALGVLQILALDIGTDTLPAVALGAEPPVANVLERAPVTGRLLSRTVVRRAFGLLGPTEAALSISAFVVSFLAAGWRPGASFPEGHIAESASGAAFLAVVLGQAANAFACRSSTRWPGALGWRTNRLLAPAVAIGVGVSMLAVFVGPVASALGQARPSLAGTLVAAATPVAVLAVDALDKHRRRRSAALGRGELTR